MYRLDEGSSIEVNALATRPLLDGEIDQSFMSPLADVSRTRLAQRQICSFAHIETLGPPWQVGGYPRGYTQGLHQQVPVCTKARFCGAFSKPFYCGGEGGILTPVS
jgi:hypothetical protein